MLTKDYFYNQDDNKTLPEKLDEAWQYYCNQIQPEENRLLACQFLLYALDIDHLEYAHEQLFQRMEARKHAMLDNVEYIPNLSPQHLNLTPKEMVFKRTQTWQETSHKKLKALFEQQEMLDVDNEHKINDEKYNIKLFDKYDRASKRVHIYQGQFYQGGQLFDTQNHSSHGKPGYAGFTLNVYGELSVFSHLGASDKVVHSTLNAGIPVVCAGELVIQQGMLKAINTYSGHYKPTLFNLYRALEYFCQKGVNIAETYLYTFDTFPEEIPFIQEKERIHRLKDWKGEVLFYKVRAELFFNNLKNEMNKALNHLVLDAQAYQVSSKNVFCAIKNTITCSHLNKERKKVGKSLEQLGMRLLEQSQNGLNAAQHLETMIEALKALQSESQKIALKYKRKPATGRLYDKITFFIDKAVAVKQEQETLIECMKRIS